MGDWTEPILTKPPLADTRGREPFILPGITRALRATRSTHWCPTDRPPWRHRRWSAPPSWRTAQSDGGALAGSRPGGGAISGWRRAVRGDHCVL